MVTTKVLLENILKKIAYGKKDNKFNSVKKNIGSSSFRKDSYRHSRDQHIFTKIELMAVVSLSDLDKFSLLFLLSLLLPISLSRGHGIASVLLLADNRGLLMYPVISEKSCLLRCMFFSFPEQCAD